MADQSRAGRRRWAQRRRDGRLRALVGAGAGRSDLDYVLRRRRDRGVWRAQPRPDRHRRAGGPPRGPAARPPVLPGHARPDGGYRSYRTALARLARPDVLDCGVAPPAIAARLRSTPASRAVFILALLAGEHSGFVGQELTDLPVELVVLCDFLLVDAHAKSGPRRHAPAS